MTAFWRQAGMTYLDYLSVSGAAVRNALKVCIAALVIFHLCFGVLSFSISFFGLADSLVSTQNIQNTNTQPIHHIIAYLNSDPLLTKGTRSKPCRYSCRLLV